MQGKLSALNRRKSVFWNLLTANLAACLCAVAILAAVFIPMMQGAAKKNDRAYEQNILYTVVSCLDGIATNADSCREQAESSSWLHEIYVDHVLNGYPLNYSGKEASVSDLSMLAARYPGLASVSIRFYDDADILYTSSGVFSNVSWYQEHYPEKIFYFFFPIGAGNPGFDTIEFQNTRYLIYRMRLQDVSGGRYKAEMNLIFSSEYIASALSAAAGNDAAAFRITNTAGDVLWSFGSESPAVNTETVSGSFGRGEFRCEIDIPSSVCHRTLNRTRPLAILAIALDLMICIVSSIFLSLENYRPVKAIARKFAGSASENDNELEALDRVMDRILVSKTETETSLVRLRPLARQRVLGSLLEGTAFLDGPGTDQLRSCGVQFSAPLFNVIAVRAPFSKLLALLPSKDDLPQASELAMETLLEHLGESRDLVTCLYYEDSDRYQIIANYSAAEALKDYLAQLDRTCAAYFEKSGISGSLFFGVGAPIHSVRELYRASEQAATAVNFGSLNQTGRIVWFEDVAQQVDNGYFYPFSEEMLLSRAVSSGNDRSARAILLEVIEQNKKQPLCSQSSLESLYGDLYSTIMRSARSLSLAVPPDDRAETQELSGPDQIREKIDALIERVCAQIESRRREVVGDSDQDILSYIDDNILDPNLSLSGVAGAFHKSTAYVSSMFKSRKGVNYSDYVNQVRITKAVELLACGQADMEAVYRAAGYVSLSTFRRNYAKFTKRNPGCSGGQLRPQDEPGALSPSPYEPKE